MTKAQKQMLKDKVLGKWPKPFSIIDITTPGSFNPSGGWYPHRKDKLKVIDEMLAEGTIELVSEGSPIPLGGGEFGGKQRVFRVVQHV
jgi:hypothetical protein